MGEKKMDVESLAELSETDEELGVEPLSPKRGNSKYAIVPETETS